MEKSPEAFRTIREVADGMDLPQHVLRFWETRFPQIRPLKRAGGRRYYRPDDVERLRVIKRLLYEEGYTIRGVQKLFKAQGAQAMTSGAFAAARPPIPFTPIDDEGEGALPRDPALDAAADEDEALPFVGPDPGPRPVAPVVPMREIEGLRGVLADIRQAERLLLQARAGEG